MPDGKRAGECPGGLEGPWLLDSVRVQLALCPLLFFLHFFPESPASPISVGISWSWLKRDGEQGGDTGEGVVVVV